MAIHLQDLVPGTCFWTDLDEDNYCAWRINRFLSGGVVEVSRMTPDLELEVVGWTGTRQVSTVLSFGDIITKETCGGWFRNPQGQLWFVCIAYGNPSGWYFFKMKENGSRADGNAWYTHHDPRKDGSVRVSPPKGCETKARI